MLLTNVVFILNAFHDSLSIINVFYIKIMSNGFNDNEIHILFVMFLFCSINIRQMTSPDIPLNI